MLVQSRILNHKKAETKNMTVKLKNNQVVIATKPFGVYSLTLFVSLTFS
jgi:hypothetical protein